jgi:hypothetical protein
MMYELQVLKQQRWQLDTVYDDKALAIDDARCIMAGKAPPPAVRVVATGEENRVVFKKKAGGFASLREVRSRIDVRTPDEEERLRLQRLALAEAEAEAARQRRMRQRRLVAAGLAGAALVAILLGGSAWLYR